MLLRRLILLILLLYSSLDAKEDNQIGIYENLGATLPLNVGLTNEYNQKITLKDAIKNKPTILTLNYFDCPGLCSPLLNEVAHVINKLQLKPYLDYNVITISINPDDNYKKAKQKKDSLLKSITKSFPPQTWSFLTTNQKNIDLITNTLGFKYEKRIKDGVVDYLHPSVIIVITPKGKISRYSNGIEFLPFDLKLALLEASDEKSRPTITKTLLYCFAYDAKSKTYVFQAEKVVGSFIFGVVFLFFAYLIKTGRRKEDGN